MTSPYEDKAPELWGAITSELIDAHPLEMHEVVDVVRSCWDSIFKTKLAGKFQIGRDIQPKPQIMGFLLHELIPLELADRHPGTWRADENKDEKDIVYIPDQELSVEIKTSSNPSQVFGNRSYAQKQRGKGKSKNGYYLAVNFQKFDGRGIPQLTMIRFGWLDHSDWIAQKSPTGQQARIRTESDQSKLRLIYSIDS